MPETGIQGNPGTNNDGELQDIYKASSVQEIRATLAQLKDREAAVTARLDALVASQKDLSRDLGRLDLLRAHLGPQVVTTRSISNGMLSDSASTAQRISSAVKRLDLEQSRVKATLGVVEQVSELKACILGLTGSMGAPQDWEKAAGYLSRASRVPKEITNSQFAEEMVPTAEVPDPPSVTLESAAESLCGLFLREFEKAAREGDGAKVTRFFKLFPLIDRSHVGLDIYGRYICQGVATRTRANLNAGTGGGQRKDRFFYANILTKLFEHIAQVVEGHGALVERHYGAGSMVKVIERLQLEADIQGGIILDTWTDERTIDRRINDVKSYAFSFLVQSFLPQQKPTGVPRTGSPASKDVNPGAPKSEDDEGADLKEVDGLLNESGVMLGRWSLYCRFLASKCADTMLHEEDTEASPPLSLPPLISDSGLYKKVDERLISPFNIMTTFFFRRSVEKAFQLDEPPSGLSLNLNKPLQSNPPYITSSVDDVMYIVNAVVQRSLATSQRAVVAGVVPTVGRVLGSDFVGMIQRKMRDESYPKPAVQGGLPPEDKIIAFLVLINNLDIGMDYIKRIVQSQLGTEPTADPSNGADGGAGTSTPIADVFLFDQDAEFVTDALKNMKHSFEAKTTELINDGIYVTFDRVIKPRLRSILADAFRDADYLLPEDGGMGVHHGLDHSADDPDGIGDGGGSADDTLVKRRFEHAWDALMNPLRRILTERNYHRLLSTAVVYLGGRLLEKRIWSYYGKINELGAVRLERDVAGVVGAVVKGGRYGLRDALLRCTQICLVMTMEDDEWEELNGVGGEDKEGEMEWKISREERHRARAMVKGN